MAKRFDIDAPTLDPTSSVRIGIDAPLVDPSEPPDVTAAQIDDFLDRTTPFLSFTPLSGLQEILERNIWDTARIDKARTRLDAAIVPDPVNPPDDRQVVANLDKWWLDEGMNYPRFVLDELGVRGGVKPPSLAEKLNVAQQATIRTQVEAVRNALQLDQQVDPLITDISAAFVADPSDLPGSFVPTEGPELKEILQSFDDNSLQAIGEITEANISLFEPDVLKAVKFELDVRDTETKFTDFMIEGKGNTAIILWGTDFFNRLALDLPGFLDRKMGEGELSVNIEAISRIRAKINQADPGILTSIGTNFGDIAAEIMWFAALPDPGKIKAFSSLSKTAQAAISVGGRAGFVAALRAPGEDETIEERALEVATATGIGAITGVVLERFFAAANKVFDTIKDIPVNKQADAILFNNPDLGEFMTKQEMVSILKHMKSTSPEQFKASIAFKPRKVVPSRVVGKGLRLGAAEIEKPSKAIGKAISGVAKTKEAIAAQAALQAAKALPSKAIKVEAKKPTKILTKAEARMFQESNLVTGEDVDIKIVADPATRRTINASVKEIAKLETQKAQLQADKKVALAKTKAVEIAKKQEAVVKLKEKHAIKVETTIEGFKLKADEINRVLEFKQSLRQDVLSLIQGIPAEIRNDFITRAMRIGAKTQRAETSLKRARELAQEASAGIEKLEQKLTIREFKKVVNKIEQGLRETVEPQKTKLRELIDSVDLKALTEPKEQDLLSLQNHVKKLSGELAGQLEALDPAVEEAVKLPDKRVRELLRLSQDKASDMSLDDLKFVLGAIQQIAREAVLKGRMLVSQGFGPVRDTVRDATKEIVPTVRQKIKDKVASGKAAPKKTKLIKAAESIEKFARHDEAHLDTLAEGTGSESTVQILDTDTHKGMRGMAEDVVELTETAGKSLKDKGMSSHKDVETEHEVTLAGQKVTVTMDDLVGLEMDTRSSDNLKQRLRATGIHIGDHKLKYPPGDVIDRMKEINDAVAIVRADKAAMALGDTITEMTPVQAELIQPTHKLRFGYDLETLPDYYPRQRVGDRRVSGPQGVSRSVEKQGRYQPRTGGNKPLRVVPGTEALIDGIEMDAAFSNMTLPLRNARILLENPKFVQAMKDAGREAELTNMIEIIRRTQGVVTSRDVFEVFTSKVLGNFSVAVLGGRISTVGTQVMSFYAAMAETGRQQATNLQFFTPKEITRIQEDSALMQLRWSSRRVGVEVGQSASEEAFDMLFFDKITGLRNKAMTGLVAGDKQAVGNIYYQLVTPELLNTPRNGKNVNPFEWEGRDAADLPKFNSTETKEFRYAAARRLEYVVRRTQPMFDVLDRSVALSSPNPWRRGLTKMFSTAVEAQENILMRAVNAYLNNPTAAQAKLLSEDFASVAAANLAVALWKRGIKWAIGAGISGVLAWFGVHKFRDKRNRDEIAKDVLLDSAKNLVRMNPVGRAMVVASEIAADKIAGEGYNWNREAADDPVSEVINSGVTVVGHLVNIFTIPGRLGEIVEETTKGDKDFNEQLINDIADDLVDATEAAFTFGAYLFGAPILAPVQELVVPAFSQSKIKIIREIDFGDLDDPQDFSQRVNDLFEQRSELRKKSKSTRLSRAEERTLKSLDNFATRMNKKADSLKEVADRGVRATIFETLLRAVELQERLVKQE